ncbi:MAG: T9SS type A sorting domain-containing protein [Lewinella sp.]|uniref:T9SS type A sorting domain-containing protein n=1 Tax=Lewinella sp. TaxID=2004506 RepID=UPI003D6B8C11
MKQFLLLTFSLLLSMPLLLNGQITLESTDYFPAIGDTLRTVTDNAPTGVSITTPGGSQSWNFTSLQNSFSQELAVGDPSGGTSAGSYPTANVLMDQAAGGEGYYISNSTQFAILGYAGTDPLGQGFEVNAPFIPEYVERWAPLNFFDLRNHESALTIAIAADDIPGNIFDGLPITPDSIRVRVATTRTDLVDAWGTLSIPGGDYDVLREKRTEYRDVRLDAKIGPFPWADITDLALDALPIDALGSDTIVTYSFWSDDAKEAIAVINADPTGTQVERVTYKDNGVVSNNNTVVVSAPSFSIYPNPAIVNTRFEFNNVPVGNYTMDVYNLAGRSVWRDSYRMNGHHVENFNVTRLKKGMYLCVLSNDKGERIGVKRLLVTTP